MFGELPFLPREWSWWQAKHIAVVWEDEEEARKAVFRTLQQKVQNQFPHGLDWAPLVHPPMP